MKKGNMVRKLATCCVVWLMALLVAVGSTFSWYDRSVTADANARILNYSQSGRITSNAPKTIRTYLGTENGGVITYSDAELSGNVTVLPNRPVYFKTVIEDSGNVGESNISLYSKGFTCTANLGNAYHIGLLSPEKTCKAVTASASGNVFQMDRICIADNLTVPSNGSVEVCWFIQVDNPDFSGTGTLTPEILYTVFN